MLNFNFLPERLENGVATGDNQRELIAEIRSLGREGVKLMAERMNEKPKDEEQAQDPKDGE